MIGIIGKFSLHYKKSLKKAACLALELNHEWIKPEHLLYGLMSERGSLGSELLTGAEIKTTAVKNSIAKINSNESTAVISPKLSKTAKDTIQKSTQIAFANKHKYVGTEHLLSALIQTDTKELAEIFQILNISKSDLERQAANILKSTSKLPELTDSFRVAEKEFDSEDEKTQSILDVFGRNLTSSKWQKRIDPVIGREREIQRVIEILSRRNKNNPIILGEPGVGKTALIEGLAKKITKGDVPEILQGKKIYALDLTSAVAGTMFRGDFENRIKQIIDEVTKTQDIILFIDEIHNIVGTGSASGSMDTANILKPALARGDIRCIGATTFNDYRRSIENDPALDRRFQPIRITEPDSNESFNILMGLKSYFEDFHKVKITEQAIKAAITLSQRYLPEKFLPDKAIDLIDEAASGVKVNWQPNKKEKELKECEKRLTKLEKEKRNAILQENFLLAIRLKDQILPLKEKIANLKNILEKQELIKGIINIADITRVLSQTTGIPVENLATSEKKLILNLTQKLQEKIIGQNQALDTVSGFIQRAKTGLMGEEKPLASFLFAGPSGVGKTYTAKILSRLLFGTDGLVKIDMSEYSEKFNISKLIGAPAGYVGYKESGQLTEKIKHKPYSLVLLDEIEKANPEIFDLLLQILDDGYLTDAVGTKINFRNTIIVMTANIGSQYFKDKKNMGFGDNLPVNQEILEEKVTKEIKDYFKPEFLNRLDKIVYFSSLPLPDLIKIVKLELELLDKKLSNQGLKLEFDHTVIKILAQKSLKISQGARGISKTIQETIETPLAHKILKEEITSDHIVRLSAKNGIIQVS